MLLRILVFIVVNGLTLRNWNDGDITTRELQYGFITACITSFMSKDQRDLSCRWWPCGQANHLLQWFYPHHPNTVITYPFWDLTASLYLKTFIEDCLGIEVTCFSASSCLEVSVLLSFLDTSLLPSIVFHPLCTTHILFCNWKRTLYVKSVINAIPWIPLLHLAECPLYAIFVSIYKTLSSSFK